MSASRMATSDTSGRSRPSRSRLMPTSTSNSPSRRSRMISMRSMVSMSCVHIPHPHAHRCADIPSGPPPSSWSASSPARARCAAARALISPIKVVDLPRRPGRTSTSRIEQARRADDLLHDLPRALALIVARRRGDVDAPDATRCSNSSNLSGRLSIRAGQAEAVLHQRVLARAVAVVHRPHLRQRDMRSRPQTAESPSGSSRAASCGAARPARAGNDAGIVLDARAVAQLAHHLDVVLRRAGGCAAPPPACPLSVKNFTRSSSSSLDLLDGALHLLLRRDIVRRGIDRHVLQAPSSPRRSRD